MAEAVEVARQLGARQRTEFAREGRDVRLGFQARAQRIGQRGRAQRLQVGFDLSDRHASILLAVADFYTAREGRANALSA